MHHTRYMGLIDNGSVCPHMHHYAAYAPTCTTTQRMPPYAPPRSVCPHMHHYAAADTKQGPVIPLTWFMRPIAVWVNYIDLVSPDTLHAAKGPTNGTPRDARRKKGVHRPNIRRQRMARRTEKKGRTQAKYKGAGSLGQHHGRDLGGARYSTMVGTGGYQVYIQPIQHIGSKTQVKVDWPRLGTEPCSQA